MKAQTAGPTAALAGVPAGLQAQGLWIGRRQLFIRFAAEAETATMYTASAIAQELQRSASRSAFHSISVGGRDPLANLEFLEASFKASPPPLKVLLDIDGQRPDGIKPIAKYLSLVQVTIDGSAMSDPAAERALASIANARAEKLEHAMVLAPGEQTSDGQLLRIVEQAHAASAQTVVVIHPPYNTPIDRDRRWVTLIERAAALHPDVRLSLRLPPPTGTR